MSKGKNKCKILKQIRAEIARNNGIDYVVEECRYKGDCTGTCPKCEAEVRMLEEKLAERASLGKRVLLTGVAAGIVLTASACGGGTEGPHPSSAQTPGVESTLTSAQTVEAGGEDLGYVPYVTPEAEKTPTATPAGGEDPGIEPVFMGDVVFPDELKPVFSIPVGYDGSMGGPVVVSAEQKTKELYDQLREYVQNGEFLTADATENE